MKLELDCWDWFQFVAIQVVWPRRPIRTTKDISDSPHCYWLAAWLAGLIWPNNLALVCKFPTLSWTFQNWLNLRWRYGTDKFSPGKEPSLRLKPPLCPTHSVNILSGAVEQSAVISLRQIRPYILTTVCHFKHSMTLYTECVTLDKNLTENVNKNEGYPPSP